MTLVNKGFDGTVTESDFARMMFIGAAEGVESSAAWAVTQGAGRQVSVAASAGHAFACGVVSKDDAGAVTANLSTPTNGQWFLIVRRITWASNTVAVAAVAHSTTSTTVPTLPPSTFPTINQDPGVLYDQPLAWAWCRSTDTTVAVFDLRKQPLGGRIADVQNEADLDALIKYAPVPEGRRIHVDELNVDFQARDGVWVQVGPASIAAAARDAAYAKAASAFRVDGASAYLTDKGRLSVYRSASSKWTADFPVCRLTKTTAQNTSASAGTFTAVAFDQETFDPDGMHDNVTNNSRIVAPVSGYYRVSGKVRLPSTGAVGVAKNGAAIEDTKIYTGFASGAFAEPAVSTLVYLAAGDYVELLVATLTATQALFIGYNYFEVALVQAGAQ